MSLSERAAGRDVVERLAAHLERQGITLEEIGRVARLGGYQTVTKDPATGVATTHDLYKFELSPKFEAGPEWPVVDRGPAVRVPARTVKPAPASEWSTAVLWPDTQIGYFRNRDGELEATHDEAAVEIALALTRAAKPDRLVRFGDDLDLPELGRYRTSPAFAQTTQASIDRNTLLGAQQREAVGPDAEIDYLSGNHEERLVNYLLDNARAAFGLRRGGVPEEWPVLSVPYLCRLDDFGIRYHPGYPAADLWLTERLRVVHGLYVRSRGSTSHAYLDREKSSVVFGHTHRREWAERTRRDHDGPKTILAASPGCLARTDGAVPSTKGGVDLDGRPIPVVEDWQQGIAVVRFRPDDGRFVYEQVPIFSDGPIRWAVWQGREYVAT